MTAPGNKASSAAPLAATGDFVAGLLRWRWPLLLLACALGAASWYAARGLQFDRRIENLFAQDDPLLEPYRRLRRTFGGDQVVLVAYDDPQALAPSGLDRLARLTAQLAAVEGVAQVVSLTNGPLGKLFLTLPAGAPYLALSEGFTISADRRTVAVVCLLDPQVVRQDPAVNRLRALVEAHDPTGVVAGEPAMVVDGFALLEQDGRRLGLAATGLLLCVLVACFRSLRWTFLPLVVVYLTLYLTQALLVLTGLELSMVSSMLWAIVTVIGVGTVMHLIVGYRAQRAVGLGPAAALSTSGTELAAPILWSLLTDAVGFGSLMLTRVGPVRDFGLMTLTAALLTLPVICAATPALALAGRWDADPHRAWGEGLLDRALAWPLQVALARPRSWAFAAALLGAVALAGALRLQVESDFTRNFRAHSPLVRSYEFVETRLGGAGVWDVLVPLPDGPDEQFVQRVRRLEARLRDEVVVQGRPGLAKVISLVDVFDLAPALAPRDAAALAQAAPQLAQLFPFAQTLYGIDPQPPQQAWLRIMLRASERQPAADKQALISQVRQIAAEEFPAAEVSGYFVLLARLIGNLLADQWLTFGLASAGVLLCATLALRSLRLGLIAIVPNVLPILCVLGLLGWLGIPANMGVTMIASVSVGLSIDSALHYLTVYRRQRATGATLRGALTAAHDSAGRAMVFSTLALIAGFSTLALSAFVPTIYFGMLVSLALLGALLGNLLLLPLLLRLTEHGE